MKQREQNKTEIKLHKAQIDRIGRQAKTNTGKLREDKQRKHKIDRKTNKDKKNQNKQTSK